MLFGVTSKYTNTCASPLFPDKLSANIFLESVAWMLSQVDISCTVIVRNYVYIELVFGSALLSSSSSTAIIFSRQ